MGVFNITGIECILEDSRLEVQPVWIHASDKTRLLRSLNREESPDCKEICRRFQADEKDFSDMDDFEYWGWINEDIGTYESWSYRREQLGRILHKSWSYRREQLARILEGCGWAKRRDL